VVRCDVGGCSSRRSYPFEAFFEVASFVDSRDPSDLNLQFQPRASLKQATDVIMIICAVYVCCLHVLLTCVAYQFLKGSAKANISSCFCGADEALVGCCICWAGFGASKAAAPPGGKAGDAVV